MAARLRILDKNLVRSATITASSQVGNMLASNLKKPNKSSVWRGSTKVETLTLRWATPVTLSCLVLAFCNLSPTGTVRVRGTNDTTQATFDTTAKIACVAPGVTPDGMTDAEGTAAYAYGGGNTAISWFTPISVHVITIDIVDNSNLQGYIEVAMLMVGAYWSPARNPSWGAGLTRVDRSKNQVMESGTLKSNRGTRSKKLSLNLNNMEEGDRAYMDDMLARVGTTGVILACLFPESADPKIEQAHTVVGKVSALSAMTMPYWNASNAPLEIEQV